MEKVEDEEGRTCDKEGEVRIGRNIDDHIRDSEMGISDNPSIDKGEYICQIDGNNTVSSLTSSEEESELQH